MPEKEFGKLSSAQLKQSVSLIQKLLKEAGQLIDSIDNKTEKYQNLVLPPWAELYEKSFNELGIIFLHYSGFLEKIKSFESADKMQAFFDYIESDPEYDINAIVATPQQAAAFLCSFIPVIHCLLSLCRYRKSINRLLEEARQGIDKSLFRAICIDRTVLSTKTAAARLAQAEWRDDRQFFDKLARAVKGGYPKRPKEDLDFARMALAFIEDATGHAKFNSGQLYSLFVEEMKVFPDDTVLDDSLSSFRVFLHRERKS